MTAPASPEAIAGKLSELAERCEQATGADHVLDAEIHCALHGYEMHEDSDPSTGIFAFWENGICHNCSSWSAITVSLDAAMGLIPEGHQQPSDIVREALNALGRKFNLHMSHWLLITPYGEYLARFVTAASLRARASHILKESNNG